MISPSPRRGAAERRGGRCQEKTPCSILPSRSRTSVVPCSAAKSTGRAPPSPHCGESSQAAAAGGEPMTSTANLNSWREEGRARSRIGGFALASIYQVAYSGAKLDTNQ